LIAAILGGLIFATRGSVSAPPESTAVETVPPADAKEALASFNELIGDWRGVGMPRRGSAVGAWSETALWVWEFTDKTPAILYEVKDSQLLKTARLTWDAEKKQFRLKASLADDSTREYVGKLDEANKLVLESPADDAGNSHRITVTQLNEKRTLVLHEQRTGQGLFRRVAEVGYTRAGTSLAVEGAGELECVVTGGKGTMPVSYQGKTYYVCCSGCKQAFDDDPAGIIAEYEKKVAARKAKK
jgi:YHS domain-containing protein